MLKVLRNLKESFWSVLIIVALLVLQAWCDLTLPDFTSRIVDKGIQASGIENATPKIISKDSMDVLLSFTDQDDKILDNYMINGSVLDAYQENLIDEYYGNNAKPEANTVYILRDISKEEQEELSKIMAEPIVQMAYLAQAQEQMQAQAQGQSQEQMQAQSQVQTQMQEQVKTQVSEMQDSIKEQAAVTIIKEMYKQIGVNTDALQNRYILIAGLQMLGVAIISATCAILIMLFSSRVAAKLGKTLREKVFSKVLKFSRKELVEFSTASLITRSTNDIQQIQMMITMLFRTVIYAPIMGTFGFIKVLNNSHNTMTWIVGVAILAIVFIVGTLFIIAMPKFKKLQDLIDRLNLVSREILTGLPVIRAFNKETSEEERFDVANTNLMKTNVFVNRAMSMMMPLLMFVMNSTMILIIWAGGHGVDSGVLQVGDMMAFIQYMMHILISFLVISSISIMLPRASISAKRINEVLETEISVKDKKKTKKFDKNKKGLVEFKNVSFRYPDADTEILSDIDFTARPGETTAIIGSTGSGKSTIVNLIPRFYDVTGGELRIDGVNVKEVSQKDLRNVIGFVPQKGVLFSGTIESNIKYSNESMSNAKMKEAAEIAQATEFIESKDRKYNEEISQGGTNVSGGQRQRLSIARAIAKDPEIFVFDDSFSALDFKTDTALREALRAKTRDKTVIIVAQRISTILNAEQIIVLDEGKVVGIGTHEELMKNNEVYKQIALSQLTEEELSTKGGVANARTNAKKTTKSRQGKRR